MAAGTEVGAINVAIRADVSDFDAGVNATIAAVSGLENSVKQSVKPVDSLWASLGGVKGQLATLGIGAAVGGIIALTKSAIDIASALKDTSDRIGLNVEALQELDFAAGQVGLSTGDLHNAISIFTRNLGDARNGTGALAESLRKTNPELLNMVRNAGSVEAALDVAFQAIANAGDQTQKAALAVKFFGRSGTQLLPILADGTKGLADMRARARELGLVMSTELVEGADRAGDRLTELGAVIKTNLGQALLEAAPFIEDTTVALIDLAGVAGNVFGAINKAIREDFANQEIAFEIRTEYGSVDAAKARLAELQTAIGALQALPRTDLSVEGAQQLRDMQFEASRIAELLGTTLPDAAKKGGQETAGAADKAKESVAGLGRKASETVDALVVAFPEIGEAIEAIEFDAANAGLNELEVALRENERAAGELGLKYGLTATEIELASTRMNLATSHAFATEAITEFQTAIDDLDFETSIAGLSTLGQAIATAQRPIQQAFAEGKISAQQFDAQMATTATAVRENFKGEFAADFRKSLEGINAESEIFNEITGRNATELEKLQHAQGAANQRVAAGEQALLRAREEFGEFSTEALVAQNNLRIFAKEAEEAAADVAGLEGQLEETGDAFGELGSHIEDFFKIGQTRSYEIGVAIEGVTAQLEDLIDAADPDALREFSDEMRALAKATQASTSAGSPFEAFLTRNANQLYAAANAANTAAGQLDILARSEERASRDVNVGVRISGLAAAEAQLDSFASQQRSVTFSVRATGSPEMDISRYFGGYLPRLFDELESDVAKRALVFETVANRPLTPSLGATPSLVASPAVAMAPRTPGEASSVPLADSRSDTRTNERVAIERVARAIEANNAEQIELKRQIGVLAAALPTRSTESRGRGGF